MRRISKKEAKQRGCEYCLDRVKLKDSGIHAEEMEEQKMIIEKMREKGYLIDELSCGNCCKHKRCPYRELDKYNYYRDFLKHEGDRRNTSIIRLGRAVY